MSLTVLEQVRFELLNQRKLQDSDVTENKEFCKKFENLFEKIIIDMLSGNNSFFANFIINFRRQLNFNINEPFSMESNHSYFILHINPFLVLQCSILEIEALIKHEIYHLICLHQIRSKKLIREFGRTAVNIAMDIAVNQYIINLPHWSETLESVNLTLNLSLTESQTLESYAKSIGEAIRKKKSGDSGMEWEKGNSETQDIAYDFSQNEFKHKTWDNKSSFTEDELLSSMVTKLIEDTKDIERPNSVNLLLKDISRGSQITWKQYLLNTLGKQPWMRKKTVTRRDRRMPDRLDLRGTLSHHISSIVVAIDISGSMTEREINSVFVELKAIASCYNTKITVLECDDEIKNIYNINKFQKLVKKPETKGRTRFTPVFQYTKNNFDPTTTIIYFTDGVGEEAIAESLFHNKTIWVLTSSDKSLSLRRVPGTIFRLREKAEKNEDALPLEYLKTEMKEIRSEWAK